MELLDALQSNATILVQNASMLRDRIALLQAHGHTADATVRELQKTCEEIGKLSDAIMRQLDQQRNAV